MKIDEQPHINSRQLCGFFNGSQKIPKEALNRFIVCIANFSHYLKNYIKRLQVVLEPVKSTVWELAMKRFSYGKDSKGIWLNAEKVATKLISPNVD